VNFAPIKFGSSVGRIKAQAKEYASLTDQQLSDIALDLGFESRQSDSIRPLIVRGFALVQVAAQRQLGMQHYDVQLMGGEAMCHGHVAEMQTGEGKTLTATLPLFVHALAGRGALLATSNDYLAKRDAESLQPLYNSLGLTVGVIQTEMSREQRRAAYACHITYGTMKEFGFDFLRDHSGEREQKQRELWYGGSAGGVAESATSKPVHRAPHFLLIDEADSILIDDARTPLIISAPEDGQSDLKKTFTSGTTASVARST
jgi:preprotein translocase subunit SecA